MKALKALVGVFVVLLVIVSCDKEPGNPVLTNPLPPEPDPGPSPHKIRSEQYFQIVFGFVDSITFQEADTFNRYVNVAQDLCFCEVRDSINNVDSLIGYHYSPSSAMWPFKAFNDPKPENYKNLGGIAFSWEQKQPVTDLFTYQQIIQRDTAGWGRVATTNQNNNGDIGASIFYVDKDGVEWASDNGLTLQPDGYIVVKEYKENDLGGSAWRVIDYEFKCLVYNDSGSVRSATGSGRGTILTWD